MGSVVDKFWDIFSLSTSVYLLIFIPLTASYTLIIPTSTRYIPEANSIFQKRIYKNISSVAMTSKIMFVNTQSIQLNVKYIKSGIFLQNLIPLCCMKQEDEV
jgi:hypothetical protein